MGHLWRVTHYSLSTDTRSPWEMESLMDFVRVCLSWTGFDAVLFSAFNRSLSRLLVTYWQWCYPQKYWALSFSVGPLPRQPSFATQASDLILVCPGFNPCSGAVCSISRIQHTSHGFAGVRARFRLSQFPGRSGKVLVSLCGFCTKWTVCSVLLFPVCSVVLIHSALVCFLEKWA